jgi:predicted DNA-binding antitoxin AbrB/MazE fold protein
MGEIEAVYEEGVLRIVKPAKIESDVVTVRILNKDEMLTEEDMKDILNAMDEREKGNYYKLSFSCIQNIMLPNASVYTHVFLYYPTFLSYFLL